MSIEPALTRHMAAILDLERESHTYHDEVFDLMLVDEYCFGESDFYELNPNGYAFYGHFGIDEKLLGFVVLRYDETTKTVRVTKIEILRDGSEKEYFLYIVDWVITNSHGAAIVYLVSEVDYLKIACLKERGFKGELRRNAFRKTGCDGVFFKR